MALDHPGSSPESEAQAEAAAAAENANANAEVHTEGNKPGETEDNLLAVVQSVVGDKPATPDAEASTAESPTAETSDGAEKPDPSKEDDFSNVPFNKHPRFQALVQEKNKYKAELAEYEPDAKEYRQIRRFMDTNALTAEEVAESMVLAAQMKADPAKAAEVLQAKLEGLKQAAGEILPPDLEKKVADGYVDRETALEMNRARVAAERKAALAERNDEQRAQQDAQARVTQMAGAVAAWEQATKATDPDFDLKVDLVKDRVRAHVAANGMPKTAEEAVEVSKKAHAAVTDILRKAAGTRPAMRPAVGGKTSGSARPEPTSLLDVVRNASA